jgi:hypothetical protein
MRIDNYHLTYCTNIHPGESWTEVFESLKKYILPIKQNISPEKPFGIGLRLSNVASIELLLSGDIHSFKYWLQENNLYVFTINGFPYGGFHGEKVKDAVHKPDWISKERIDYTIRLCNILAVLLPEDMEGGISTSPLSYKPWFDRSENNLDKIFNEGSNNFLKVIEVLHQIKMTTGKTIHLDMEPEPDGLIENTDETIDFFSKWLLPLGKIYFKNLKDLSAVTAEEIIKTHFRVCYDVCHFAIAYEDPHTTFSRFKKAGIKIGKIQISAALKTDLTLERNEIALELAPFIESTYLHQVIERDSRNNLVHYNDLPMALEQIYKPGAREWRTHFHVPLFINHFGLLQSTQDEIKQVLDILKEEMLTSHLEIETYTWEVLPFELKIGLQESIEREMDWVIKYLNIGG